MESTNRDPQIIQELLREHFREMEYFRDIKLGCLSGVASGFIELDQITCGWQKSDLIIIAGRPSMGKTAFALNCARNAAIDFDRPVAIFSFETSSTHIVNRLIASEAEIEQIKMRKNALEEWDWQRIHSKIGKLENAPLIIDDTPALNISEFSKKCRVLKKEHDIQLFVIDYLQLMRGVGGDGKGIGDRWQEIGSITRALKALAKELNTPIIALSQLSRAVENRPGASKRPMLSDLAESGSIEQDADLVLFLYRPEYYGVEVDEDNNLTKGKAEVIVAKHRNGDTGIARLNFIQNIVKFENIDFKEEFDNSGNGFNKSKNLILRPSRMDDIDDEPPF